MLSIGTLLSRLGTELVAALDAVAVAVPLGDRLGLYGEQLAPVPARVPAPLAERGSRLDANTYLG
jgi:hypothetical protein